MRAPAFWYRPPDRPGIAARLLTPLGWITAKLRSRQPSEPEPLTLPVPVICLRTLTPRHSGMVPAVIALVQHLERLGHRAVVACKAGRMGPEEAVEVDPARHRAEEVGDDAMLIAAFTKVWVARDATSAARSAARAGAVVITLEDGRGPRVLSPDIRIVVADAIEGFGNGLCRPAGPLREPVASALSAADLLLSIGPPKAQKLFEAHWAGAITGPHLRGQLEPLQTGMDWQGASLLAFTGIGTPEGFFASLRGLGATLLRAETMEAHQPLTRALMARLDGEASALGAQLVTTERDAMRLPLEFRQKVLTLPLRLRIENGALLDHVLAEL